MRIVDLVDRSVVTVPLHAAVLEAAMRMKAHNVGCVLVLEDERVVGILTDRDIVMKLASGDFHDPDQPVASLMSRPPICARGGDDLDSGLTRMRKHHIRRLPVLNDDGELIGVVTLDDILLQMSKSLNEAAALVREEVAGIPQESWHPVRP